MRSCDNQQRMMRDGYKSHSSIRHIPRTGIGYTTSCHSNAGSEGGIALGDSCRTSFPAFVDSDEQTIVVGEKPDVVFLLRRISGVCKGNYYLPVDIQKLCANNGNLVALVSRRYMFTKIPETVKIPI